MILNANPSAPILPNIDWQAIDLELNYFAVDANGEGRFYNYHPLIDEQGGFWYVNTKKIGSYSDFAGFFEVADWKKSLICRYESIQDSIDTLEKQLSSFSLKLPTTLIDEQRIQVLTEFKRVLLPPASPELARAIWQQASYEK